MTAPTVVSELRSEGLSDDEAVWEQRQADYRVERDAVGAQGLEPDAEEVVPERLRDGTNILRNLALDSIDGG